MNRHSNASIDKEPLTRKQVQSLRYELSNMWEDIILVTKPNQYHIITIGNLEALCDHLLQGKGLVEETDGERWQADKLPLK